MTPEERRKEERRKFGFTREEADRCLYAPLRDRRETERREADRRKSEARRAA